MDYWVVKYDSTGTIEWDKTVGGSNDDMLTCIIHTTDGGYALGGYSLSGISGEKTEINRLRNDYWVVKLDEWGNVLWDKTIGGNNHDYLHAMQQTPDGGYILGGYSHSEMSFEKSQNSRETSYDYWVVKTDGAGNVEWDKTIGGNAYDQLMAIAQPADGGYVLGGYSESPLSGEKTDVSRGVFDYWLVKIDNAGNVEWDKTMGGNRKDMLTAMQLTNDGGYFLAGHSYSRISGEKTQNNIGKNPTTDYWVIKLDRFLNIEWDRTIGGTLTDICFTAIQTKDGGYIMGGSSDSDISAQKTEDSRGGTDYWVVKLNKNGSIQWDKTIGGHNRDNLISIKEVSKNRFKLAGFSSSLISGDKTITRRGLTDYWIVNLSNTLPEAVQPVAGKENDITTKITAGKSFSVYPNPATNRLNIQNNGRAVFTLINGAGKIVCTKTTDGNCEISIADLPGGLYFLKNNATGEVKNVMVVK